MLDEIRRVPGVGEARIFGAQDYSMRIWLRPDRMAQLGITTSDIVNAIRTQNAQQAIGKIGQEPALVDQQLVYTVTAKGRLLQPEQFEQIMPHVPISIVNWALAWVFFCAPVLMRWTPRKP